MVRVDEIHVWISVSDAIRNIPTSTYAFLVRASGNRTEKLVLGHNKFSPSPLLRLFVSSRAYAHGLSPL